MAHALPNRQPVYRLSEIATLLGADLLLPDSLSAREDSAHQHYKHEHACVDDTLAVTGAGDALAQDSCLSDQCVSGIAPLETAQRTHVSFIASAKYREQLRHTQAAAVIVPPSMVSDCPVAALVVDNPYAAFAQLSQYYEYQGEKHDGKQDDNEIADSALLADSVTLGHHVQIGEHVSIGPNVTLGSHVTIGSHTVLAANVVVDDYAVIGSECHLAANVVVHHHCRIGNRVRLYANTSIGSEGFGFAPVSQADKQPPFYWERIAQLGQVIIGDDVRIGANVCIDRGALADTRIGNGVIIDNLVQVAHNVQIGDYTAIAACTGIAGSTIIGKHCIIGGAVSISGHLSIADGVTISGASNVLGSIRESAPYASGMVQMPTAKWRRAAINLKQLASIAPKKLQAEINDLKNALNRLESRLKD